MLTAYVAASRNIEAVSDSKASELAMRAPTSCAMAMVRKSVKEIKSVLTFFVTFKPQQENNTSSPFLFVLGTAAELRLELIRP
mmetsp:Transcript_10809/g.19737  ORF Transcript_10809/g.19737 Transcript_10809/m.19737 type:complete len:83 (+) Transcript_10809:792-1040(+)